MGRALRRLALATFAGATILVMLTLAAAILFLYREAASLHPVLGVTVLGLAAAGVALLIVWPIIAVVRLPRALEPVAADAGPAWERYLERYARRLRGHEVLRSEWDSWSELDAELRGDRSPTRLRALAREAVDELDERARRRIRERAALVFAMTAVSQSGRLDTFVVLSAQLRLVREVAEIYFQRPSFQDLARLYLNVGAAAFVAGEIQESEILAVLGAPVSAAAASLVPLQGTDPLISLLVTSLMDGSANGFLTLRVGALSRRYCQLEPPAGRRFAAQSASVEAAAMLGGAIGDGASRVARAVRKLVVSGAVEGTGRAARSLAGAGVGAVGKLGELADRTAREFGRRLGDPPRRILEQALRFWEGVARESGGEPSGSSGD